jgi:hypothetical protein
VVGVQPHWFKTLPPPHVCGEEHAPQSSSPPQPSATLPHRAPWRAHVVGVQVSPSSLQLAGPVPMQVFRWPHMPHESIPPHPSSIVPHWASIAAQLVGAHPHEFGPPTPHVSGGVQAPQSSVPPHPSPILPQAAPWPAHVASVQPH